ncbi:MAG: hypothetical protein EOS08_23600 [Mesorhizobium sp.]|nr:MAG: hypothetical protein EOS08_23600 [Mesorhizobium sp.]TIL81196.1 MAG: hypothetical protein E5Y81_03825 [Mesorhizobium sp.]
MVSVPEAERQRTSIVSAAISFEIGRNILHFVILGRSKERSDAAQTLGSMPSPRGSAPADQNRTLPPRSALDPSGLVFSISSIFHWRSGGRKRRSEPLHSWADVTEWIPGSAPRRFAPCFALG